MAITEQSRHQMLDALSAAIGEGPAMTLAEHLPPVGWGDVATKQDLAHLEARLDLRFEAIDHRFESIDHRFDALSKQIDAEIHKALYKSSVGTFLALGVFISALRIWG